jgi:tetratricopeptide (TPR) repeat protein
MRKLKFLAPLVWLFALSIPVGAQEGNSGISSFFLLGAGARPVGMGGSFVAVADDASAVFWNPAGLVRLSYSELSFNHVTLPEGSEFDFAGVAYPTLGAGAFSAGFLRIGTDGIFSRDSRAADLGEVSFSETQLLLGYGHRLFTFLQVGANGKFYSQSLAGFSANAFGADAGIMIVPIENLSFGVNAQDWVSSDLKLRNSAEKIPRNFKAGASYFFPAVDGRWGFRMAADLDKTKKNPVAFHAGGELSILTYLFLRAGYDRKAPTFGGGISYGRVNLDYAFKSSPEDLSASHRFGFSIRFGSSVSERRRSAVAKREEAQKEEFLRVNQARLEEYQGRVGSFAAAGQKDSALAYLRLALGIDPENAAMRQQAGRLEQELQAERREKETGALRDRLRGEALTSAGREYQNGNYQKALALLEEGKKAGDAEFAELSRAVTASLDSAKSALDSTGWRAFQQKNFDRALSAWEKLSQLDPSDTLAKARFQMVAEEIKTDDILKRGITDFDAGRFLAAEENFRDVLQRRPQDPTAQSYLQKIRSTGGEKTTLEDLQKDPEAWREYNLGLAAYTAREYQKALDIWQKLLERHPNNEALLRNIADARKRLE